MKSFSHIPVMIDECYKHLKDGLVNDDAIMIDGTLGAGGHTEYFLSHLQNIKIIGIDQDQIALDMASKRLEKYQNRFVAYYGNYCEIAQVLEEYGYEEVNAVLLDIGVSSMQLDDQTRGFSYTKEADIDMRMDASKGKSAKVLISSLSVEELQNIIVNYSEERYAKSIAKALKMAWEEGNLITTADLADTVRKGLPKEIRNHKEKGLSSIKRVFQALRIAVNNELEVLEIALNDAIEKLAVNGRIVVLSYHSLEDKIVKKAFVNAVGEKTVVELELPFSPSVFDSSTNKKFKLAFAGSKKASNGEIMHNPRAKSVRMRCLIRVA